MDEEIPLTGVLAEFRTALQKEIEAAQRSASSNAIPLSNGRKIAEVGDSYQYLFTIDSALNLPGDTPGDLIVPRMPRLETTIISTEGLSITLSVTTDLGKFVPNSRLQINLTYLMKKLIERIENLAGKANPAGERILGALKAQGTPTPVTIKQNLNVEQKSAVATSLGYDTTFIWGPPGTGKTKTIGSIAEQLYRRGRSVLLVSHTNTAVDGALLEIADALGSDLEEGRVLRVGESKNERLNSRPELLLRNQVEKRSAELSARRTILEEQRKIKITESLHVQRVIAICEWVDEAKSDLESMGKSLSKVQELETHAKDTHAILRELQNDAPRWATIADEAHNTQKHISQAAILGEQIANLEHKKVEIQRQLNKLNLRLADAERVYAQAEQTEPLRQRARSLPNLQEQRLVVEHLRSTSSTAKNVCDVVSAKLTEAEVIYSKTVAANPLTRLWKGLPKAEVQYAIVEHLRAELTAANIKSKELGQKLTDAVGLLEEITDLDIQLQPHREVPDVQIQSEIVASLRKSFTLLQTELDITNKSLDYSRDNLSWLIKQVELFEIKHGGKVDDLLSQSEAHAQKLRETRDESNRLDRACAEMRNELEALLRRRLEALREWELSSEKVGSAESMLTAVKNAHERAVQQVGGLRVDQLHIEKNLLNDSIRQIEVETYKIDEALKRLEEIVISEATIIATTLTRAYLRDAIQARRFDTVILDEASMAPIPALWVAASLAESNIVVVGDFRQLPPIVLAKHELAQTWLGQDIFEIAGMREAYDRKCTPEYFVALKEQYRMHPDIRAIPDKLIYDSQLRDYLPDVSQDTELDAWFRYDWGHDTPVLIVDTGPVQAWVTSVAKGGSTSRLNFLSATICIDLAERFFRDERPERKPGDKPCILIICPYSPHAKLLKLLIRQQSLDGYVEAGTIHSFQGSEASIVIFDLVNDEPHWRVGMFNPERDESTRRLLNVALTRARRRLVVIGDFDYCEKLSKKAFLGRELIPFLRPRYKLVNALDVIPVGLAARAAKAQSSITGGEVESSIDRLVVTQADFYRLLLADIGRAQRRVVIYSPFFTQDRVGLLETQIKAAIERGVRVYVITKAQCERRQRELAQYRFVEKILTDWNVVVIHKLNMHEKLVFIDDNILWSGSLNPLSHSNTQEVMERRNSREVSRDYSSILCLRELIGAYDAGDATCPICGKEVIPAEGGLREQTTPFYWRCVEDGCYARSINEAPIKDGLLKCQSQNCGGPVEYGEWGGEPHWRCLNSRHHRQRIHRNHLKLHKMRALVPKNELRKLDKQFGLDTSDQMGTLSKSQFDF